MALGLKESNYTWNRENVNDNKLPRQGRPGMGFPNLEKIDPGITHSLLTDPLQGVQSTPLI